MVKFKLPKCSYCGFYSPPIKTFHSNNNFKYFKEIGDLGGCELRKKRVGERKFCTDFIPISSGKNFSEKMEIRQLYLQKRSKWVMFFFGVMTAIVSEVLIYIILYYFFGLKIK